MMPRRLLLEFVIPWLDPRGSLFGDTTSNIRRFRRGEFRGYRRTSNAEKVEALAIIYDDGGRWQ